MTRPARASASWAALMASFVSCSAWSDPQATTVDAAAFGQLKALAGGTGFDPARDRYASGVDIRVLDPAHFEIEWRFNEGRETRGSHRMQLERVVAAR